MSASCSYIKMQKFVVPASGAYRDYAYIRHVQPRYGPLEWVPAILERPRSRYRGGGGCADFRCLNAAGGFGQSGLCGPGPHRVLASRREGRPSSRTARDAINHHWKLDFDP